MYVWLKIWFVIRLFELLRWTELNFFTLVGQRYFIRPTVFFSSPSQTSDFVYQHRKHRFLRSACVTGAVTLHWTRARFTEVKITSAVLHLTYSSRLWFWQTPGMIWVWDGWWWCRYSDPPSSAQHKHVPVSFKSSLTDYTSSDRISFCGQIRLFL